MLVIGELGLNYPSYGSAAVFKRKIDLFRRLVSFLSASKIIYKIKLYDICHTRGL
jgi:hypothetical protein